MFLLRFSKKILFFFLAGNSFAQEVSDDPMYPSAHPYVYIEPTAEGNRDFSVPPFIYAINPSLSPDTLIDAFAPEALIELFPQWKDILTHPDARFPYWDELQKIKTDFQRTVKVFILRDISAVSGKRVESQLHISLNMEAFEQVMNHDSFGKDPEGIAWLLKAAAVLKLNPDDRNAQVFLHKNMGSLRTASLLSNLNYLAPEKLVLLLGGDTKASLTVLRRFGSIHSHIEGLSFSQESSVLVGDSACLELPEFIPSSLKKNLETIPYHPSFRFELKDLKIVWGEFSRHFKGLSLKRLEEELEAQRRLAIDEHLLKKLRKDRNNDRDLDRSFFFAWEDYRTEDLRATLALVDGAQYSWDSKYELPLQRAIRQTHKDYDLPRGMNGALYELHSMAKDPGFSKEITLDKIALTLAAHIKEVGAEDALFYMRTDKVGARLYSRYGFTELDSTKKFINEHNRILVVSGRFFIQKIEEIYPLPWNEINTYVPNHVSKRLAERENDYRCEMVLSGKMKASALLDPDKPIY